MPIMLRHELGLNSRMSATQVVEGPNKKQHVGHTLSIKRDFATHGVVIPKEERLHRRLASTALAATPHSRGSAHGNTHTHGNVHDRHVLANINLEVKLV